MANQSSKLDGRDYRIILSLADNSMNVTMVGSALYMHRNTVLYHMEKIKRITGLDPGNFYDLHKLVAKIKGAVENE